MEEKKRIAKGIKLNASQLPLTNKGDFVIGKDSRKVLDSKIIENLNGANHGYFPSTLNSQYRTWSVSRELEIPNIPDQAESQMRMIEGETAAQPLQNDLENPFAHEPNHAGENQFPYYDPSAVARLAETHREILPQKPVSEPGGSAPLADTQREFIERKPPEQPRQTQFDEAPSPWGAPTGDTQTRYVVKSNSSGPVEPPAESPWAGPEMLPDTSSGSTEIPARESVSEDSEATRPEHSQATVPERSEEGPEQASPSHSEPASASSQNSHKVDEPDALLPDWMNALVFDADVSSELQAADGPSEAAVQSEEAVELETFLNSIPDEEFAIDNETMRHLFSSLCEPKSSSMKIKSAASEAADLAIAAAAAEILKTEVSIDEISIQDLATQEMLDAQSSASMEDGEAAAAAEFEAIQKAYEMLDLTPLPNSLRKESAKNVYEVVKKAADEQAHDESPNLEGAGASSITRTERGTIEMAIHAGGRQLIPTYNFCGMLTSVAMSDGLSFVLSEEKNIWHMIEQSGKVMVSGIQSVSFDKLGNLSYVTKRGDVVTLKIDGTIDTKFAKKGQVPPPTSDSASAGPLTKKVEPEASGNAVEEAQKSEPKDLEKAELKDEKAEPKDSEKAGLRTKRAETKDAEKAVPKSKKSDSEDSEKEITVSSKSEPKSERKSKPKGDTKSRTNTATKTQSKSDDKTQPKTGKSGPKSAAKSKKKGR